MTSSVSFSGRPVEHILVTVDLSRNATAAQLEATTAEVAGEHVYVQVPGHKNLDVHLPFAASAQGATASWEKENKRLLLGLPYLSCRGFMEQVQ